jgi:predicted nucleic acid-binding protein
MPVIIDASVALKWVIDEDGSEAARGLLLGEALAAPDLIVVECAIVLWAKARRRQLNRELALAERTILYTADAAFVAAASRHPRYGSTVRFLG